MPQASTAHQTERRRRALFDAAMRLPEEQRQGFIERKTGADAALRDAVLRLVAASRPDTGGILDNPVYKRAAPLERRAAPPSRIGPYAVVRRLGTGGMGDVYCCHAPGGGTVAVKLLRSALQDPYFRRRFEQERTILSKIDHPNICRILDAGISECGEPFIVMELVEGERIDAFCRRINARPRQTLELFSQVLAGVEYCHRQQIVHRDLKPANVLVTHAGKAKILDFGIAKLADHAAGMTGVRPTRSAVPLMTVRYASPEQLRQMLSGRSSDIFSLGVLLHELITGRHPFAHAVAAGAARLLAEIESGRLTAAAIVDTAPDLPHGVASMLVKALQSDPHQRYGSAGLFQADLKRCLETILNPL
jgi:serine/threonine-protein kinase